MGTNFPMVAPLHWLLLISLNSIPPENCENSNLHLRGFLIVISSTEEAHENGMNKVTEARRGNIGLELSSSWKWRKGGCLSWVLVVKGGPLVEPKSKKQVFQRRRIAGGNAPRLERTCSICGTARRLDANEGREAIRTRECIWIDNNRNVLLHRLI